MKIYKDWTIVFTWEWQKLHTVFYLCVLGLTIFSVGYIKYKDLYGETEGTIRWIFSITILGFDMEISN